jgi:hypothetical protein
MTINEAAVLGYLGAVWGLLGVSVLLGSAIWRLSPYVFELADLPMTTLQWVLLAANVVFMAHSEGYKGFQKAFSPRVAARTRYLRDHPQLLRTLLAPLFCMGFFHATKKRMIVSYVLTLAIVGLIVLVRMLEQPWRGIVDAGVVVGLSWGLLAYWIFAAQALTSPEYAVDPEVSS